MYPGEPRSPDDLVFCYDCKGAIETEHLVQPIAALPFTVRVGGAPVAEGRSGSVEARKIRWYHRNCFLASSGIPDPDDPRRTYGVLNQDPLGRGRPEIAVIAPGPPEGVSAPAARAQM